MAVPRCKIKEPLSGQQIGQGKFADSVPVIFLSLFCNGIKLIWYKSWLVSAKYATGQSAVLRQSQNYIWDSETAWITTRPKK